LPEPTFESSSKLPTSAEFPLCREEYFLNAPQLFFDGNIPEVLHCIEELGARPKYWSLGSDPAFWLPRDSNMRPDIQPNSILYFGMP
jgi:hypothetical protein